MHTKTYRADVKAVSEGTARAVFATTGVVDLDGDYTVPGAFSGNTAAKVLPAHDWGHAPIGIARISEVGNEAIADMKFNLDMPSAAEWFRSMKFSVENGLNQEFSYGFRITSEDRRTVAGRTVRGILGVQVYEVSPVLVGAGVNTRLTAIKTCSRCGGGGGPMETAERIVFDSTVRGIEGDVARRKRRYSFPAPTSHPELAAAITAAHRTLWRHSRR